MNPLLCSVIGQIGGYGGSDARAEVTGSDGVIYCPMGGRSD